jgi:SAM-dependent methyltransferase
MSRRAAPGMPSHGHPGRQSHNWSIYDAGDRCLLRHAGRFRGVVLDLGCGSRTYEAFIGPRCERYIGVDWSESLHSIRADLIADLNEPLPLADDCVDTVACFSVLEHLRRPGQLVAEALRVLKPGGSVILQVPFMWQVHEAPHDYYRFTCFGLRHLFEEAGFDDILVEPTSGFWTMWVLKLNYQLIRLVRGPAPLRGLIRLVLAPWFWVGQRLAAWADRYSGGEAETAGYFVVAAKPCR